MSSKSKEPLQLGEIIGNMVEFADETKPQRVYVVYITGCYDGDTSDARHVNATTDLERAKSMYLAEANESESYFLNRFENHALINRDDETMYCECYAEGEEYCRWHNLVFVKTIEL